MDRYGFDLEEQIFCYFIIGTAFPLIWGVFFLLFSFEPILGPKENCSYLINWGLAAAVLLFCIAAFYLTLILWSLCTVNDQDFQYVNNLEQNNPKLRNCIKFEENWIRIIIGLLVLVLFSTFGIIQSNYGEEVLKMCGSIFQLGELFFYIMCGLFALLAIMCLVICSTDIKPDIQENQINARQPRTRVRYAHHYNSIEDMF